MYPLFSPQSLIAEGTANYGIEVAFPGPARVAFEKAVLFPAAGLDASQAGEYYRVQGLVDQLAYAGNEAARRYLNGQIDRAAAAAWLERYALMPKDRAEQRVRFFDQYRSYVINYNLGKDLVRRFIEARAGTAASRSAALGRVRKAAVVAASPLHPPINRRSAPGVERDCDRDFRVRWTGRAATGRAARCRSPGRTRSSSGSTRPA